jgi:hypothetical protein
MKDWENIVNKASESVVSIFELNKLLTIDVLDIYNGVYLDYKNYLAINRYRRHIIQEDLFCYILRRRIEDKSYR